MFKVRSLFGLMLLLLLVPATARVSTQGQRQVLTPDDFEYIGAMRVPVEVTGYNRGGRLAHRKVNGELRFFMAGHVLENGPVYEFNAPGFAPDWRNAPRGSVVQVWGDVYGGRKIVANDAGQVWTEDLEYFNDRLYWSYGHPYPVAQVDDPSIGVTDSQGPAGPWRTSIGPKLARGYITVVPQWYADAYLGGRRLAVGSGLRSGNITASWGPNLAAIPAPTRGTSTDTALSAVPLVEYSYDNRLDRENNYIARVTPPDLPGGWWTQQDFIESAVWIDLPDKHGVVFFGGLAGGNVWYGGSPSNEGWVDPCGNWQGPHAQEYHKRWWIYDPMDFVPVRGGNSWDVRPSYVIEPNQATGSRIDGACFGAATGAAFDPETRTLYVAYPETEPSEAGNLSIIYAFRIRGEGGGSTPPPSSTPPPTSTPPPPTEPNNPNPPTGDTEAPSVPANFRVTTEPVASGNVMTRWDAAQDNVGVVNYELYRDGVHVGNSAEPFNEDGPIVTGVTYRFQVRAVDAGGNRSAFSSVYTYTGGTTGPEPAPGPSPNPGTGADTQAPTAPSGLTVTLDADDPANAVVRWNASTDNIGVVNYELFRDGAHVGNGAVTFNEDGPIEVGRTYRFEVRAVDAAGNRSALSSALTYTRPSGGSSGGGSGTDTQAPTAPAGLHITTDAEDAANVVVRWNAASDNVGVVNYELFRDGVHVGNGAETFNEDGPVIAGRTYRFEVRAVDAAGNRSALSAPLSYTRSSAGVGVDTQAPTAPSGLHVTTDAADPANVVVRWNAASDNVGVVNYELFRDGVHVGNGAETFNEDGPVEAGGTYHFQVRAVDAAGNRSTFSMTLVYTRP